MSVTVKGATGKLKFTTANSEGVAYDPTDFVVIVADPTDDIDDGETFTYVPAPGPSPITRLGFGIFLLPMEDLLPGRYHWRARAVDPTDAGRVDVSEGSFRVNHSRVVSNAA
jgi:hypothetical protein